jgi:hypothetical protein
LGELVRQAARLPLSGSDTYSAPELVEGTACGACDQYSLAMIYAELLTGVSLRPGRGAAAAVLAAVQDEDRPVLARALHADPRQRFAGCVPLFQALEVASGPRAACVTAAASLPALVSLARLTGQGADPAVWPSAWQFADALVTSATRANALARGAAAAKRGGDEALECRFPMKVLAGMVRLKLDAFRDEWGAQAEYEDAGRCRFRLHEASNFWQRCLGQQGGLELEVRLLAGQGQDPNLIEVAAVVRPLGDAKGALAQKLPELGPQMLASLRDHLQNVQEKRARARQPFAAAVHVYPVFGNGELALTLRGTCKDLSRDGIRFALPRAPATDRAYLHFPGLAGLEDFALLAEFVRMRTTNEGECDTAAAFCLQEAPVAIPV